MKTYCRIPSDAYGKNGSVALRSRKEGELGEVSVDAVVEKLNEEVRMKAL